MVKTEQEILSKNLPMARIICLRLRYLLCYLIAHRSEFKDKGTNGRMNNGKYGIFLLDWISLILELFFGPMYFLTLNMMVQAKNGANHGEMVKW